MKQELKQHIIDTLKYLKEHTDIDELTINQIYNKFEYMTTLLRNFVELSLEDKETQDGTMTEWWLYQDVNKVIFTDPKNIDVNKAEDFVNFMLDAFKPVG